MDCMYCRPSEKLDALMIKIVEMPYSTVYLNRDQKHRGRCIVALRNHKTEYFQLSKAENAGYFAEVSVTSQAIQNLYGPDKLNYATFGDGMPHVHVHIVPKYRDGLNWGQPYQDNIPKVLPPEDEYTAMIAALRAEIVRLAECNG